MRRMQHGQTVAAAAEVTAVAVVETIAVAEAVMIAVAVVAMIVAVAAEVAAGKTIFDCKISGSGGLLPEPFFIWALARIIANDYMNI